MSFPHALGAPGIGWTAWNQADSLVRAGHEVHLVAASFARRVPGAASATASLSAGRVRIPHRAIGRDRAFAWHDRVAAGVLARTQVDVVHLWPLAPGITARAARARGIPAVREAPNTHTRRAWRTVADEISRLGLTADRTAHTEDPAHLAMETAEWDAVTGILAPSEPVAESFIAEGFAPERILRHRYGHRPGTRLARVRGGDRPLRVVYVGLAEPRKGLHHALRAWADSTASERGTFLVVGRMLPGYADMLAPLLAHPGVEVVGFSDRVDAALASADVMVLPTLEEGSALVTYEAQAAGCVPLVSSAAGAVIDHGIHGLVHAPGDVAELTRQLDRLDADREELARLSAAALAHAPELTWDAAAEALVAAYRQAVERTGARDAAAV
ncbi:glycosyltransferase family 4 protein [Microbacterium thalassium]|uniref:Glycosyltransferase involved in cell wall biosynthesis n=1 Tax=Microbacterium thalassium TaxID=362649 RepID=A0A7X0FMI2_9MICO|nr:glycosyltransferase family 4 protein [Microbacterium thalassium]MBB6390260.1 glycosyltransferase involved in cell wall biosynthesis [Microbacterium thalassium]